MRKVLVRERERVREGEALVVVEAMKMEHTLRASFAGVVETVKVFEGDSVAKGVELVVVKEEE